MKTFKQPQTVVQSFAFIFCSIVFVATAAKSQTNIFNDAILRGSKAGQTVKITKSNTMPELVSPRPEAHLIRNGLEESRVPLDVIATRYEGVRIENDREWPLTCVEFRIQSRNPTQFQWSCWAPDSPRPHRFQILSGTARTNYACYVGEGIHLYRLVQERSASSMRQQFLEQEEHPDALPTLSESMLLETIGFTNMLGLGPQTWNVTVDSVSEVAGELRMTIHGASPNPSFTFTLHKNTWELVSK